MKKQTYQLNQIRLFISGLMIFMCVTITQAQLPEHWTSQDIGDVAAFGNATVIDSVFIINGSGSDIWFAADAFHFAYQPAEGDCEISAYVALITTTAADAKACVMIRETLDANSAFAMTVVCPGPGFGTYFQRRPTAGSECGHTNLDHSKSAPVWLKLIRAGNTFTAYFSDDGSAWNTAGDPVELVMPENVFIGLGVCAHNNDGSLCETRFENVEVDPGIHYTGINKLTSNDLFIYPNPVSDKLTLNLNNNYSDNAYLTIANIMGKIVLKETLSDSKNILDLKALPSGVYLININSNQGNIIRKIIKN